MSLSSEVSINQTICGCDGGLAIFASGGYPPYSFSINNGLNYNAFPIFNNLCEGNYVVITNDISGNSSTNFVTLNPPSNPTTYTIYLNTTSQIISTSPTQVITEYKTYVNVFPTLQSGVTISFKINHSNLYQSSPNEFSSSGTSNSSLIIDTITIPNTSSGTTTGSTFNPIPGCQGETLYLTTFNEEWSSLSYTLGTEFELTTIDIVNKNEFIDCYIGTSQHNFTISNVSISGCGCCSAVTA